MSQPEFAAISHTDARALFLQAVHDMNELLHIARKPDSTVKFDEMTDSELDRLLVSSRDSDSYRVYLSSWTTLHEVVQAELDGYKPSMPRSRPLLLLLEAGLVRRLFHIAVGFMSSLGHADPGEMTPNSQLVPDIWVSESSCRDWLSARRTA